jgi:hypothetical protein
MNEDTRQAAAERIVSALAALDNILDPEVNDYTLTGPDGRTYEFTTAQMVAVVHAVRGRFLDTVGGRVVQEMRSELELLRRRALDLETRLAGVRETVAQEDLSRAVSAELARRLLEVVSDQGAIEWQKHMEALGEISVAAAEMYFSLCDATAITPEVQEAHRALGKLIVGGEESADAQGVR